MRTKFTPAFICFIFSILVFNIGFAQNTYLTNDRYPKWRLGLNMGGTWQTNDLKKNYAGLAGGFNIERILNRREDAPIGFSLGFRYLSGNTYGYDNTKDSIIGKNPALNGTNYYASKYDSTPGYFYDNYFTHVAEGALELKINFPAMEKRTHFIFHVFGGLGFSNYKGHINALDDSSKVYDFSKLGANPSISSVRSFYKGDYETLADGNTGSGPKVLAFTPSLGIGIGYRFNKHVALVLEHRVSFPQTDVLDGRQYSTSTSFPLKNDIYHYTAANLIFTIWGHQHHTAYNSNTNPVTTNTVQTNPNVYTTNNQGRPVISVYSPVSNPYTTTSSMQQVTGVVQNISSAANMTISLNSYPVNNFTFNPNNGSFSFPANLVPGNNTVHITASNNAGQDSHTLTINYSSLQSPITQVVETPPQVQITYPSNNYVSASPSINVNAYVTNVSSSSNIAISVNGYAVNNFNFNPYNGSVTFSAPLVQGSNAIIVSAFNSAGNNAQQVIVNYTPANQVQTITTPTENRPVVSYNNPSSSPFESITKTFNVTAKVTNVTSASQVAVQYNGLPINDFTFTQYGYVNFTANLNPGSNVVVVTGTNSVGSDTKTAVINYKENGEPPIVKFVNPASNPSVVPYTTANVMATVANVQDQNHITVLVNNSVSPFTYNTANQTVSLPVSLNPGNNTINITGTNTFGTDSKTMTIERKTLVAQTPPTIKIINPSANPFTTNNPNGTIVAQTTSIYNQNEITVTNNGLNIPFVFDNVSQQILINTTLVTGNNTFVVSAQTTTSQASASTVINYVPVTVDAPKAPTVTIVDPNDNPHVTADPQITVKATTTNVNNEGEVSVLVNGVNANFNFNNITKEVTVNANLNIDFNSVVISVANSGGSDSKTAIIQRIMRSVLLPPVVTVISPQSSPYASLLNTYQAIAEVINVSSSSEITVTKAGATVPFTFDNANHLVKFNASLSTGNNIYIVKATNQAGSDSKTITIVYQKPVTGNANLNKPVVTFTNPSVPSSSATESTKTITANITYITQASQASILVNGVSINNFTYNNGTVTFNAALNIGNNTITVTGTNAVGSDSKSIIILHTLSASNTNPTIEKPIVTFTTPSTPNTTVNIATQTIVAYVANVTVVNQVAVLLNGNPTNNFNFSNGNVSMSCNLNEGANTITVTGTNTAGSDTKTITLEFVKTISNTQTTFEKPVVTFTQPASISSNVTNATQNINANVTNVSTASQVKVIVNGAMLNNFSFNNGNVTFNTNLNIGPNTITVTGTNAAGSDSKSVIINYSLGVGNNTTVTPQKPVVTFTQPASSNSNVTNATQNINANVTNVSTASQVKVIVNGAMLNNFSFNNGNVTFNTNLNIGPNTITVTGTNVAGSDSKSVTINYSLGVGNNTTVTPQKPVVTFTQPASSNSNVTNATQNINANVTNVSTASQVKVIVNGAMLNNFSFNNGNVTFNTNLNIGPNTITVTGTNAAGSDSKSVTINYSLGVGNNTTVTPQKPVVTFTQPASSNSNVINATQNINANVTNVSTASQVKVIVNGTMLNNFSFNNGNVTFNTNLNIGPNTITVTGTNVAGSDSKLVTINYSLGVGNNTTVTPQKPVVTFTSSNPATENASEMVTATITNISSSSQVEVTVNNIPVNSFTFSSGNIGFTATLNYGNNAVTVKGTNTAGSDLKSITIIRNAPPAPIVIITKPTDNPHTSNQTNVSVIATVQNVNSQSEISVNSSAGGNVPFTYNPGNHTVIVNATLNTTYTTFTVTASNAGGTDSKTVTFKYEPTVVTGNEDMITICHHPPGNPDNTQELQIPTSAWPAHQAHGDTQGPCPASNGNNGNGNNNNGNGNNNNGNGNGNNNTTITICHHPPGNPDNTQELQIPTSAWPAHQAHGDTQGPCSSNKHNNNGNGNGDNNGGNKNPPKTNNNTSNPKTINTPTEEPKQNNTATPKTFGKPKLQGGNTGNTTEPKKEEPKTTEEPKPTPGRTIQPR